jgi:hypothetical protein
MQPEAGVQGQAVAGLGVPWPPMPVLVLIPFVALLSWFIVAEMQLRSGGYVRTAPVPTLRVSHDFQPGQHLSVRGGSRVRGANASIRLVTLSADEAWAHMSSAGFTGEVWIDRSAVTQVRAIRTVGGGAIRFETADGMYDSVVFWTFSPRDVLARLSHYGWPVAM